jgi:glycosyltransferase involved in cell wall biosynthesis
VVVVDDGSTDAASLDALRDLTALGPVRVVHQSNAGVSAARNAGLGLLTSEFAVVLDGDDGLEPEFVARTAAVLEEDPEVVAASSWLRMHGAADALVKPAGGGAADFLHRNACPATALIRRERWRLCDGYDESMRAGFEDWDFFLRLLTGGGRIEIVPEPLIRYRTAPASANIRSMGHRLELYGGLIDRHRRLFEDNLRSVLVAHEAKYIDLMSRWEELADLSPDNPSEASYGDGGMAAVVRIAARRASARTSSHLERGGGERGGLLSDEETG